MFATKAPGHKEAQSYLYMKQAYLSIGYQNRKHLQNEIDAIQKVLAGFQTKLFVFVDEHHFSAEEEKQMMAQAFADIHSSSFLIAEASEKAIGVGIEIGYAAALNKPIIYLRNIGSPHSTTAAGSASYSIIYTNSADLTQKLTSLLLLRSSNF